MALDPSAGFQDDGGTPGWRARHAVLDIYPSRRAAMKAYLRRHPMAYVALGIAAGLGLWTFFLLEAICFVIYAWITDHI